MYFLKRKTFTLFLLILSVLVGGYMMLTIPKEYYPEIKVPVVVVQTVYPGASATEVEENITEVLENSLVGGLDDVDQITSRSSDNVSVITVQFFDQVNVNEALVEVKDKVDEKRSELPRDANESIVSKVNFSDQPIYTFALSSTEAYSQLRLTAEDLENELLGLTGVSSVEISGIPEREVNVLLDPQKLSLLGVDPNQVVQAIQSAKNVLPIGSVVVDDRSYRLDYTTKIDSVDDLETIIISSQADGSTIFLRDLVVVIEDGIQEYSTQSRIVSGVATEPQQSIIFDIRKQGGGDITELTVAIEERLALFQDAYQGDASFVTLFNAGKEIQQNLSDLIGSGAQTIILVLVVMGLMVGFRESIIAALAVPLSFLLTFIGMNFFGQTINFITLFSLILVIGILIDSAIVVVEGIHDARAEGMSAFDASAHTLNEYSKPIIAGVLTTISIFFPLMTLSGTLGQFIGGIPRVINIVLVMSVIVALIFIPIIANIIYSLGIQEPRHLVEKRELIFNRVSSWYKKIITRILYNSKVKRRIVYGLIFLFFSSFVLVGMGLIKSQFFPPDEVDRSYVNIELPEGTELSVTSRAVSQVEEKIINLDHVEAFTTVIGRENVFVGPGRSGSNFASIIVNVDSKKNGQKVAGLIRSAIADVDEFRVQVLEPESGPPVGAPFQVKVSGDKWNNINISAEAIATLVGTLPGARDVDSGVDTGVTDIQLQVIPDRLVEYGLTPLQLSSTLRTTIFGTDAISLQLPGVGETDVVVKVALNPEHTSHQKSNHINFDHIKNIPIQTLQGEILLGYFVQEKITQATSSATHIDGEKTRTVTAYVKEGFLPVDIVNSFNQQQDSLELADGTSWSIGGATDENDKASSELLSSLLLGILLIFGVLIWQFGSLRDVFFIVSVIPLGLIGVLYGLFFFQMTLSFTAMLGFIALVGIVVNDSIILVDVMNKLSLRNPEMKKYDVVIEGATMRLRPVLLTTVTTVLGMIPLLFVSPLWKPFAFALIVGLSFATILTLILIPILYARFSRNKKHL